MINSESKKEEKIIIIKCSNKEKGTLEYWYRDMIGKEFEIHDMINNEYYQWVKTEKGINVVNINDIEKI